MSLLFSFPVCLSLWSWVWDAPVRALFGETFADAFLPDAPCWPVPRTLGPVCVQRMIARAVVARLTWLREQHVPIFPRFGADSVWDWAEAATHREPSGFLRSLAESRLHWLIGVQLDWLLHMLVLPEDDAPAPLRLVAFVGTCGRLAQYYAELKRRHGAGQARALLREDLLHYLGPQAAVA